MCNPSLICSSAILLTKVPANFSFYYFYICKDEIIRLQVFNRRLTLSYYFSRSQITDWLKIKFSDLAPDGEAQEKYLTLRESWAYVNMYILCVSL